MVKQINVVVVVVIDGVKLLVGCWEGGCLGEGFWELLGGKFKFGEDFCQVLMCELKEELGIVFYIGEWVLLIVVYIYDWGEVYMQVFYVGLKGNVLIVVVYDVFWWGIL